MYELVPLVKGTSAKVSSFMGQLFVSEALVIEFSVQSSVVSTLAFKNGGCFGEGILLSLLVSIWTTSAMDGLNAAEGCVHRSPIWSTSVASSSENLPFKRGSIALVIVFAL